MFMTIYQHIFTHSELYCKGSIIITIRLIATKATLIEQEHDLPIKEFVYISTLYYIRHRRLY